MTDESMKATSLVSFFGMMVSCVAFLAARALGLSVLPSAVISASFVMAGMFFVGRRFDVSITAAACAAAAAFGIGLDYAVQHSVFWSPLFILAGSVCAVQTLVLCVDANSQSPRSIFLGAMLQIVSTVTLMLAPVTIGVIAVGIAAVALLVMGIYEDLAY